jgi:AcrR family transcriptional regulator
MASSRVAAESTEGGGAVERGDRAAVRPRGLRSLFPRHLAFRPRGTPVIRAVLDATIDELARTGYGMLSLEQVAQRAGVHKTTVYRRWPTKSILLEAAFAAMVQDAPTVGETSGIRSTLLAVARRLEATLSSPRGRGVVRLLLGGCPEPDLMALAAASRRQFMAPARNAIQRAIERGDFRPDVDPDHLLGALTGGIIQMLFVECSRPSSARLKSLVDILLVGALPSKRSRRRAASVATPGRPVPLAGQASRP